MRKYPHLVEIKYNRQDSHEVYRKFDDTLVKGLLLALQEQGTLSIMELRYTEEKLKQRNREQAKRRIT